MGITLPVEELYAKSRLTSAQLAIWLGLKLYPDTPILDAAALYFLPPASRIDCFESAFQALIDSTDAFRMVVVEEDGVPQPQIVKPFPCRMDTVDFSRAPQPLEAAKAWAREQSLHVFDLSKPMFRAKLVKLGADWYAWYFHVNHLITDAYSSVLTIQRLNMLYRLAIDGKLAAIPAFPQYMDYAAEEYADRIMKPPAEELAFWQKKLARRLVAPSFYGRARKSTDTGLVTRGQLLGQDITQKLIGMLDDPRVAGKKPEATLFNLFAAALYGLIYRISGNRELAIGTMYHNRRTDAARDTIGVYVGALPLRATIEEGETFLSLAQKIRAEAVENRKNVNGVFRMSLDYGDYDVMLNVHVAQPVGLLGYEDNLPHWVRSGHGRETLVVHAFFVPQRGDYWVVFDMNNSVFDDHFRECFVRHFINMMRALVDNIECEIDDVDLLEDRERHRLLVEFNDTAKPYADNTTAHELFQRQAHSRPNAPAVEYGDRVLSYGELDAQSNRLARQLQSLGVAHEELVGICMRRSPAMVVAALGVMKAGAAYVPIDASYPEERLAFMLQDSGVKLVVAAKGADHDSLSKNFAGHIVEIDDSGMLSDAISSDPVQAAAGPRSLAYAIYTSGSTGWPKGVLIEHRGLCNLMQMHADFFGITSSSRMLQFSSFSFDASVAEIFLTLGAGAALCIPPEDILLDPGALSAYMEARGVTVATMPPALLRLMNPGDAPSLRTIVSVGDRCTPEVVDLWAPGRRFINGYGPTENTVCAALAVCEAGADEAPPIGRAPANVQLYVLDAKLRPLPIGTPGELYIGGTGLARGYLGRPTLTAERFIAHPFDPTPGARVYRTGDLVRYRPDGQLEFIGRVDRQVKVHGFRIELGEIEAALQAHAHVRDAVVDAREDGQGDTKLVAYVVARPGRVPAVSELRQHVARRVPRYMVPSIYVFLDEILLTPSGKVDRAALPAPSVQHMQNEEIEMPQSDVERKLAEIWRKVLHVDAIGIHDNFFERGGDSIGSIQIAGMAREAGLAVSPNHIFEHPTIAALAAAISRGLAIQAEQGLVSGRVPLTPIQHWFFELDNPNPSHWNQSITLVANAQLDVDVFVQAAEALAKQHDILRARFRFAHGQWGQSIVERAAPPPVDLIDPGNVGGEERDALQRECVARVQAGLDIERGPVLRFAIVRGGEGRPDFVFAAAHHLVVDAVSWRILLDDLERAYDLAYRGKPITFPPKTTSYKHWANRIAALGRRLESDFDYWRARQHIPAVPRGEMKGPNTAGSSETVRVSLDATSAHALLERMQHARGTQVLDVLATALAETLGEWTEQRVVAFNLETHGREHHFDDVDLSRTVGWFTSVFPVHIDLGADSDPARRLNDVVAQIHEARQHGLGYGLLRYIGYGATADARDRIPPMADVSFNYMGALDRLAASGKLFTPQSPIDGLRGNYHPDSIRPCRIEINGYADAEGVHFYWTFSRNIDRAETIGRIANMFVRRLKTLSEHVASADQPASLPLQSFNFAEMGTLIPIKPSGSRPPLFCVPGGGGVVFPFYNLVPYLDEEQPLYGLQDPSLDEKVEPFKRVEDLAAFYLDRIRSVQAHGPYYVAGWSFGGAVAYEIAQQALRAGEEVGMIAIMDQLAPPLLEKRGTLRQRLGKLLPAAAVIARTVRGSFPYVRDGLYLVFSRDRENGNGRAGRISLLEYFTWAWRDALFKSFLQQADIARVAVAESNYVKFKQPATMRVMYVLRSHVRALPHYRAQPFPGVIDVFRSADDWKDLKLDKNEDLGWGELARGGVNIHRISGSHVSLMRKPHVDEFALHLNTRLRETQPVRVPEKLEVSNKLRPV